MFPAWFVQYIILQTFPEYLLALLWWCFVSENNKLCILGLEHLSDWGHYFVCFSIGSIVIPFKGNDGLIGRKSNLLLISCRYYYSNYSTYYICITNTFVCHNHLVIVCFLNKIATINFVCKMTPPCILYDTLSNIHQFTSKFKSVNDCISNYDIVCCNFVWSSTFTI